MSKRKRDVWIKATMYATGFLLIASTAANADWINSIVNGTTNNAKERITEKVLRDHGLDKGSRKTFGPYTCKDDCSGHQAGYNWAKKKAVRDDAQCRSNSQSFTEGCLYYTQQTNDREEELLKAATHVYLTFKESGVQGLTREVKSCYANRRKAMYCVNIDIGARYIDDIGVQYEGFPRTAYFDDALWERRTSELFVKEGISIARYRKYRASVYQKMAEILNNLMK
ncbi:hypothetical protein [Brucella anthropi]|uniref:hypothetical protein n=1 Tax=Brucella anthropi TaxID=529 RepID=UPI00235E32E0|nr:hypothetical protein [Brucella anthropi]